VGKGAERKMVQLRNLRGDPNAQQPWQGWVLGGTAAGGRCPSSSGQVAGGGRLPVARWQGRPAFVKTRLFLCAPDSRGDAGSDRRMGPGSSNQIASVCSCVRPCREFAEVSCVSF